ncbi:helix-turn-helix domain-containing protein [Sandaracinobacteroides hominis]|uniref:helix-turn-helix domain-containing protein n=1 Tax=Sandaracinobacteroides hominis TaxID=2780086 RepID=UPI0018F3A0A9|nr:helix-turn-helix domain-containing protein [Sandaracinobacteroides hominis]
MDDANGVPQDEPQPTGRRRAASAVAEPQTIGAELLLAREAAGLSLEEVAQRTKVRPGILKEIEADAHDKLPALTYSLGFVKAYARTVGLDPAAAAERYRRESQKGDPIPTMVDLQPLEEKRLPSRGLVFGSVVALLLALAGFWAWGAGWLSPAPPALPARESAATEALPPEPGAVEVTPTAPAADPAAPVTVTAKEEVWLRISDGQESFFMGTMTPGQTMTLPAGRAWKLRTGRAGALDVKVGTTQVPPLGAAAEQVRDLSLAPADLLARQQPVTGGLAPTAVIAPPPAAAAVAPAVPPAG